MTYTVILDQISGKIKFIRNDGRLGNLRIAALLKNGEKRIGTCEVTVSDPAFQRGLMENHERPERQGAAENI